LRAASGDATIESAMNTFSTVRLPADPTVTAPDGSDVRVLLRLQRGGMAHFELAAGGVSSAVVHKTVEEIWFIVSGKGQIWRRQAEREETVDLEPGICLTIPLGTHFQFRAASSGPLTVIGVTMPPWPGADEAMVVQGPWRPTVG
jgi:mannose-6-phosphate isomerase-like protein (cupin superfamily)